MQSLRFLPLLIAGNFLCGGHVTAPADGMTVSEIRPDIAITLLVYDFARLPATELASWRKEVAFIMESAGIRVEWVACGRGTEFTNLDRCEQVRSGDLFLRLIDGKAVRGPGLALGYLGLAEPDWGGRGRLTVMVNNIRDLARGTLWQFPDLLAHATAHEIGHLLGLIEHSTSGVMRSDWRKGVLKQMSHAALVFSDSEARAMQYDIRRRNSQVFAKSK
jgi:hypothetical protein